MIALRGAFLALAAAFVGSAAATADASPAAAAGLQRRFLPDGSTDNVDSCVDLALLWYRSGYEPQGPSLGLMGDPLYNEILKQTAGKNITTAAKNAIFDTNLYEEIFTVAAAGRDGSAWINRQAAKCPNQRFFIAGYSKGTLPVHATYPNDDVRPRVVASLVVGDLMGRNAYWPLAIFNTSWPSNGMESIRSLCNKDDEICDPTGHGHEIHLHPAYNPQLPVQVSWMLKLYRKNLKATFPYVRTPGNFKRVARIL